MAFIRRIYYLKSSGEPLVSYMMYGHFVMPTADWDYENESALGPYADRREEVGVIEWTAPDADIERAFELSHGVRVDVSEHPPTLVFDDSEPEPEPEQPDTDTVDVDRIFGILKGEID